MQRARVGAAGLVALLALALTACAGPAESAEPAPTMTVEVETVGMAYSQDLIEVPTGTRLIIELTNTSRSDVHDLVFANGVESERLWPGAMETIDVGIITEDLEGWCSVSGHRAKGMELLIVAVAQ